MIDYCTGIL